MAKVSIQGPDLVVDVEGWDRLWALRSRLTIPLAHVRDAAPDAAAGEQPPGRKVGGARVPGVLTAGSFRQDGERVFWDVHDTGNALVIGLIDEQYARLVIEVDDPRGDAERICQAISG